MRLPMLRRYSQGFAVQIANHPKAQTRAAEVETTAPRLICCFMERST